MGQKIQLIGENLLNDTPAPFEASQVNIKPVSALKEAQAETTFDENKYDNLFSWETVGSVAQLLPSMPLVSGISDAISTRIPEVQLSDSVSFGGGGVNTPWVTNSQQVTDERLAQYAKALNIPAEYWEDLRDSKDMTEVYTKAGKIMKDQQAMTHISTVYGNQALMFGSALIDPTNLLLNGPLNVLSATAKSASVAKSLAVAGALKEANASTNVVKAAAKAGTVGSVAADSALFAATNTGLYVMDANARGMEVTTKDLLMNATMGAIAPVALKGGAFLFDKSVKAFRYMGAKVAQEKFNLKPTEKLDEMTLGEKVHHGDDGVVEPRLADGETQGELFVKDPAIENAMVKSLLDDEPLDTASMTPEGQMAFDFESPRLTQGQTQGELFDGPTGKLPDAPQEGPVAQAPEADANQINLDFEKAEAVQSPDVPQGITTPTELLRARPGYTLDGVRFTPRFKSNVDKALFIVGMEARSKHDGLYMDMLRKTFPKLSDDEIREAGIGIKELHMRNNAKVAITDKNLKAGTQDNLPVEPTWKDAVNPEGKDFEPTHVAVEPVVPKEGLQPEQVAELEKATPEVQQKVVQKVLDQKVADTPLRFNPKDAAQPYARDVEEISSLLEPLVVKDGNRLYTTLKEPLVINTEGASKGVIKLAKAVQNVDGPFVQGTTQDGKPVAFSLDELKAALTKTEPKVETTSYTPGKTAGEQKVEAPKAETTVIPAADQKVNTLHPALEGFPALGVSREVRDGPLFKGNASLIKGLDHAVSSLGKLDSIGLHFNFKKPVEIKYSFESGGSTVEATGVIKAIQRGSIQDSDGELIVKVQMVREGYSRAAWVDLPIAAVAKALKAEPMEYAPKAPALEVQHKAPHEVMGEHNLPVVKQNEGTKVDYGMNDSFAAELAADLLAWKARENIKDTDTEGYGWQIRKTGLHGNLRLMTAFPGKGKLDFDINTQAEGIAKIRGMIADVPNNQAHIQKRWDDFNEEASKVQQQVVQKDVAQKDGVSAQTDGINSYDAPGVSAIKELVAGKPVGPDGFVSVSMMTAREVSVYKKAAYTDPWGTGKKIPIAEKLKDIKKPIAILEIDPVPVRIPNEFFPDTGDFAYFRVKAQLPGKKTPQEVMLKAWSFEGTPKAPKGNQAGFITPGVALGLLAGTGLGVYAVANRDELKDDLTNLSAGIGGLMVFGMTRGKGSSVMDALKAPKSLAEVVKMPEVKANPEAVSLKTQGGQEVRLVDIRALPGREYDGTPFHTGEFKLPYFGKVRVSDPAGELSALPRNSKSQTMQSLGMLLASSISGHKTRGALNHTTADVYAQLNAKVAIHQASDAFDKGFKEFSNRNGELTPDFIIAYNSKLVSEFNDEVVRATRGETGVHPAAAKAAKAMSDAKAELLAKGKDLHSKGVERGIVAEGSPWDVMGQLEHDPKYMTRRGNPSGMYDMAAEVGMDKVHLLIKRSMLKENPKLTDDLAQVLAPHWAKVQGAMDFNEGFHVPDMDPNAFLKFVMETTKLAEPKAKELASMFLQHKVGDTTASVLKARTVLDDTFEMETTNLNGETITISMKQLFHQDVRVNHAVWVESMSGILGMAKVSLESGVDLTHKKTFQQILDQAKDELLAEQVPYADAVKEIETIRDIHAKVLGKNNKDGIFKPANKHLRLLNDTTTLLSHANFVFNALPELSNAVMQRGLENVLRDMPELAQVTKAAMGGEIADSLARAIITAHGLGDHQTAALQASLEQGTVNAATGKVQLALSQTDKANGRSVATATTKYMTIKGNLQMLSDVARGIRDITPEEWNHFARRGIDEARFNELKDLLVKHTEVDETGLLRTDASGYKPSEMFKEDAEKAMEIHAFTERMGNSAANESSGVGETNRYQHNDIGRILMKFQGTPLRMWSNLKGQVTNFDASIAASWITVSMSAALSYIMTTYLAHRGDQETLKKKLATQEIAKAAFRNGAFGIAPNVIDLASTMLGQGPVFTSTSGRAGGAQAPLFALKDRVVNTSATIGRALTGQQVTRAEAAQAVKTPLWALNAFIPFATQSLPKKRADKPKD